MNKAIIGVGVVGAIALVAVNSKAIGSALGIGDDAGPTPPDSKDGPVFPVTADSGAVYEVHFVKSFDTESGKQSFWDIFDIQGRILRYSQLEDDTNSRIFIVSPREAGDEFGRGRDPSIDLAMRDFGIRFEGGPVVTPVVAIEEIKTLPGQVLVTEGHWMATADIGFPKNLIVSASLIKAALEEQGWSAVSVFTTVPEFWPISKNGNFFIEGNWNKPAKIFAVPSEVVDIKSNAIV